MKKIISFLALLALVFIPFSSQTAKAQVNTPPKLVNVGTAYNNSKSIYLYFDQNMGPYCGSLTGPDNFTVKEENNIIPIDSISGDCNSSWPNTVFISLKKDMNPNLNYYVSYNHNTSDDANNIYNIYGLDKFNNKTKIADPFTDKKLTEGVPTDKNCPKFVYAIQKQNALLVVLNEAMKNQTFSTDNFGTVYADGNKIIFEIPKIGGIIGTLADMQKLPTGTDLTGKTITVDFKGTILTDWIGNFACNDVPNTDGYVFTVDTNLPGMPGNLSNNKSFFVKGEGNYTIDCNSDGTPEGKNQKGDFLCTYPNPGKYTIVITEYYPHIDQYEPKKIISVDKWGPQKWESWDSAFYGGVNITTFPKDIPNLEKLTTMRNAFGYTSSPIFPNIEKWNTSNVTNMSGTFSWSGFNSNINSWNTSNVTDMSQMFYYAYNFNQPLDTWNTGKVTNFSRMFGNAGTFNQNINTWNTTNVTDMSYMFTNSPYNQPLDKWNTSKVITMQDMFRGAVDFNQDLNSWNVSNVKNMEGMFMFTNFNYPLSSWNTSNVIKMEDMFHNAIKFNQPLENFNMKNVAIDGAKGMLDYSKLSTENYDKTLISWSKQIPLKATELGAYNMRYCNSYKERDALIASGLKIIGDGKDRGCNIASITNTKTNFSTPSIQKIKMIQGVKTTSGNIPLEISIEFSEKVKVTGKPNAIFIGSNVKLPYVSGNNTNTLKFSSLISSDNLDLKNNKLLANKIALILNDGSIISQKNIPANLLIDTNVNKTLSKKISIIDKLGKLIKKSQTALVIESVVSY